jgi:hypothetical protein
LVAEWGLFFNDAHFTHWGPAEMSEVFDRRGKRIEAQQPAQEALTEEHRQVCKAIATVGRPTGLRAEPGAAPDRGGRG